ncbi:hypothetical protein [Microbacterium sp. EF45047]|uniref:hypothetical protein n=1 Tax=Microbacterium sp. EF45047 TaxID=2809708 RepID=UPI00234A2D5B|nr:hypothetical protein [Microbacterium sp. EF45047]WCM54682.1 hypothetical protein JRG78_06430 [Microbacterium sp. EF45047]
MKNVLWFLIGVIGGFVAAHFMNKDPRGQELFAEIDARIAEFTGILGEAYRAQEARLTDAPAPASAPAVTPAATASDD